MGCLVPADEPTTPSLVAFAGVALPGHNISRTRALKLASEALAGTAVGRTSLYRYMVENGMDVPKDATVLGSDSGTHGKQDGFGGSTAYTCRSIAPAGPWSITVDRLLLRSGAGTSPPNEALRRYRPQPLVGRARRR